MKVCLHNNSIQASPEAFVRKFSPNYQISPYMSEVLRKVGKYPRTAVHAPRGVGKTALLAHILLWFASTREARKVDWKIITLATSWAQLKYYLWPEVHKWANQIELPGGVPIFTDRQLNTMSIHAKYGMAFPVGSKEPDRIEGGHAKEVLIILDEAKGIPRPIWDALEGVDSGGTTVIFAGFSTPGMPVGRFYDICSQKVGYREWEVMHISLEDAVKAEMVSSEWVERRALQWGRDHPLFKQHVLGLFAGVDSNSLFQDEWLMAAKNRPSEQFNVSVLGMDVAEGGADETIVAPYTGDTILELHPIHIADLMEQAGVVLNLLKKDYPFAIVRVDAIGIGSGVFSRLQEQTSKVESFIASSASTVPTQFLNKRAEAYWNLRERLRKGTLTLPDDDMLMEELMAHTLKMRSDGLIQITPKPEIKKLIGRSPDRADSVAIAVFEEQPFISVKEALL